MAAAPAKANEASARASASPPPNPGTGSWARWLDGRAPKIPTGVTWGMPWPRGKYPAGTRFVLRDEANARTQLQSWPLAYWPDGSFKWTAHALPAATNIGGGPFEVVADRSPGNPATAVKVAESNDVIVIDTGTVVCRIARSGHSIIDSVTRDGRELARDGRLVLLRQDRTAPHGDAVVTQESFDGTIERVEIEQRGPARAVVRLDGRHTNASGRHWLPFTLRLYFYAGGEAIRILHTMVFDGDESSDFIRGVGLRFAAPLGDALHDRHVRFAGERDGVFGEAVRGLTGLRRDPGSAVRAAQIQGTAVPGIAAIVGENLSLIPAFGDWTLLQPNADSFVIRKRTADGYGWLDSARGCRAPGLGYIGGPSGGIAFGIRNFWQSHPAQLDVRGAARDAAQVTLWLWAPDAGPMDLRFYHDGLGQDTFEKQLTGLEITYEDYEPGFGTPHGVARTSELMLWALPATPARQQFADLADALQTPAVITATPQTLAQAGVFGGTFALPATDTAQRARLEQQLGWLFDFYSLQQDQHGWYGFWNYGDVMHTYDPDRHVWRYDVGGYAWDNSELSTDIWLWLYFMRTGRADVFRFAEAMTRHTGEVDVHHLGRFAPLGSRHNVLHWGCSAKQLRISTVLNRRYYYYLTGDERVGDLMREQVEAARTLRTIQPTRKLAETRKRPPQDAEGDHAWLGFGTDWGSIAGAWLTEWERTRDRRTRQRLVASMRTIGGQPRGFFTGSGRMNLDTGAFEISQQPNVNVSHLSAAFGLPEVCAELVELLPVPEFERAWVLYCELYNAAPERQREALGESLGSL
ncbi:MAG: Tat pathway signal sequence domain protein, partial [Steroidobacteraceae bacterium]